MARIVVGFALALSIAPSVVSAAWWNPFSWGGPGSSSMASTSAPVLPPGVSGSKVAAPSPIAPTPTVEELLARIAQLEAELAKVRMSDRPATIAATPSSAPSVVNAASDKSILAQYAPAIVLVETATSSGAGAFIDPQGHILVAAQTVWAQDSSKIVYGVADKVTVTLSSGAKKSGVVIGIDQGNNIAVVQVSDKTSPAYLKSSVASGVGTGDRAYVFSYPVGRTDAAAGYGFVAGTVSRRDPNGVEVAVDSRPIDNGGAMVDAKGVLLGIPRVTSCKILEEMSNCLKYAITAPNISARLPKLVAGMRLYTSKKSETLQESNVRGALEGMYQATKESGVLQYAVRNVTNENSFDVFNDRLANDESGKMTRLYLTKLKNATQAIYEAVDFLKQQSYGLDIFFKQELSGVVTLDGYQTFVLNQVAADNLAKFKEYESKVAYWSKKRNEYDAMLANPSKATHDYLMLEGATVESAADYLNAEKDRILKAFSGETVKLF